MRAEPSPPTLDIDPEQLTIEQFADRVGMSARNIRAHQARGLLPPPVRVGRRGFYRTEHLRRVEAIHHLQRQGYNLVAIGSIVGEASRHASADTLTRLLTKVSASDPTITPRLTRLGVIGQSDEGVVIALHPRAVRAALGLQDIGVAPTAALRLLGDVLEQVGPPADQLVHDVTAKILAAVGGPGGRIEDAILDSEQGPHQLAGVLVAILGEAFRAAAESISLIRVVKLLEERADPMAPAYLDEGAAAIDVG